MLARLVPLLLTTATFSLAATAVNVWPGTPPDAQFGPKPGTETVKDGGSSVYNVSLPTFTVYSPKSNNTGAAVVVFPGGGYQMLAVDLEGTEVCDWLTAKGITCVLLKYRVPDSGPHWSDACHCHLQPKAPLALEDAQRTLRLVRMRASSYGIEPHKIGVLGFSAGGHLVADISNNYAKPVYPPIDAADRQSARPDFAIALYPGHLWREDEHKFALNPSIHPTRQTPPTFIAQAENDPVDNINQSLVYYIGLKDAGVPAEMHLYAEGGHAFGLRQAKYPITRWPELAETWMRTIHVLPPSSQPTPSTRPATPSTQPIPIWPAAVPDADRSPKPGTESRVDGGVTNVANPTATVYPAKGKNTGAAVVVFPGGGYQMLALTLEGTEACDWLSANGITCVLLKYRVPQSGPKWNQLCGCYTDTGISTALEDAQRTMGLLRLHTSQYSLDPHKIGVLGFSAGGHLVAALSTTWQHRAYRRVDSADDESCRPDFAIALYPGHLWTRQQALTLNHRINVTHDDPPTFLVQAENDNIDSVNDSLSYYIALKDAKVPAEMHLYAEGKHAFGLRPTSYPITRWPELAHIWLGTIGVLQ